MSDLRGPCNYCGCPAMDHPTSNSETLPAGVDPCKCGRCKGYKNWRDIGLPTSWGIKCLRCGEEKLLRVCDAKIHEGVCHDCYDTLKASAGLSEATPHEHQDNPYHHVAPNGAEIGATIKQAEAELRFQIQRWYENATWGEVQAAIDALVAACTGRGAR